MGVFGGGEGDERTGGRKQQGTLLTMGGSARSLERWQARSKHSRTAASLPLSQALLMVAYRAPRVRRRSHATEVLQGTMAELYGLLKRQMQRYTSTIGNKGNQRREHVRL